MYFVAMTHILDFSFQLVINDFGEIRGVRYVIIVYVLGLNAKIFSQNKIKTEIALNESVPLIYGTEKKPKSFMVENAILPRSRLCSHLLIKLQAPEKLMTSGNVLFVDHNPLTLRRQLYTGCSAEKSILPDSL